jgi:hypothetical protein
MLAIMASLMRLEISNTVISVVYLVVSLSTNHLSNFRVEWLTILLRILEVPGSSLGPEIGYPE